MERQLPYLIFEVANVHGGEREHLMALVERFKTFDYLRKGIKFQIFKPDLIALPDFEWYRVYRELYFDSRTWSEVIHAAHSGGDVWLDIFDNYGIEILQDNITMIHGIKLQASILENTEVYNRLRLVETEKFHLMINISGFELSEVHSLVQKFQALSPSTLILQIGFQAYPTAIEDTALQKIPVLRAAFPHAAICLADHAPASESFSRRVPVYGYLLGCSYIEKHFCISRQQSKYDHFSALEAGEMEEVLANLADVVHAKSGPFVSTAEYTYLAKSKQTPVLRWNVSRGAMLAAQDLCFRRTSQAGMTEAEIQLLQREGYILACDMQQYRALHRENFASARIGVVVACRMKSSRLKNKAILPIQGIPSVERCLASCLRVERVQKVVLATSILPEDAVLKDYVLDGRVGFFQGDPEDVISRFIGACEQYGIDVIVRVTADCPVVSAEIIDYLLMSHFEQAADYTGAAQVAPGSAGEIYNLEALKRILKLINKAPYSEYMTWYMRNNPEIFKINIVDLPRAMIRDYRLTLDYVEDMQMFEQLFGELARRELPPTLENIFQVLDNRPDIPALNQHRTLRYQTDAALIEELERMTKINCTTTT